MNTLENYLIDEKDIVKSKIRQRRSQMLVHSYIYYIMDENLVSDDQWQKWANDLAQLQELYPDCCKINFFDEAFNGWDGSTGYHLPLKDDWVITKAEYIYDIWNKTNS
jgi:hypothetical protein